MIQRTRDLELSQITAMQAFEQKIKTWAVAIGILLAIFLMASLGLQAYPFRLTLYVCGYATIAIGYFAYTSDDHGFDV